ncbi:polysaccharide deacetylase [Neobacillus bataviensis LMG 21833]|uniref:Polysaccharide deacetylase n=1 Tax=Neobacillus bataviensis LMG 21833 TaxID=1117379 RepID=K6DP83_9BACI|nr:polysaccharide deacetylase family protein [Neobacillus bataviensis]EKN70139.1 polysaccharide deacetylase [Neobacillus bataviensis LMG 21833]
MKKSFLLLLFSVYIGLPTQAFAKQNVPILVYHSIAEYNGTGSKELYVTPENFEKQIKYLQDHGFTLLTFERWRDMKNVNKPIFITLDDGYKNNKNVLTVFRKLESSRFKPTATIFVISDFIGRSNRLSSDDLKMFVASGYFSIQSHTATHPDLTKITDYAHELKDSKEKIESITGKPVIALSYPYGSFNKKVVQETKKYYLFGITTTPELFSEKGSKDELYYLPRIYVKNSTNMEDFANIVD